MTKITLQELCWCIFWILVIQNKSSLSPLKFVKILNIPKNCHFWQKKALKWSSYFIFVLYRYENGGIDTRIKFLPWCITKLWAFANIVARGPIATMQNCKYFEMVRRYRHNFCFYTPILHLREPKYDIKMTLRCISWTKMMFLLIFGLKWAKFWLEVSP